MFLGYLSSIWHSTTFRLGLRFMALFSVSFLILGAFVYWQTLAFMEQELRTVIDLELGESREAYFDRGPKDFIEEIAAATARDPSGVYILLDDQCRPVAGSHTRLDEDVFLADLCQQAEETDGWLRFELDLERGFRAQIPEWDDDVYARLVSLSGNHRLIFGRMGGNIDSARQLMESALTWGLAVMAGLAILGSLLMAGSVANRLEQVNKLTQDIRHGDLSRRMPENRGRDEFDRLSRNLNDMLDQIESLMDGVKLVSDSIAHDLRTPLTRLRGRLEQLRGASATELDSRIDQTIEEADKMMATFNALLRIAQIEAGSRRADFKAVDLDTLVTDILDLYEPLAAAKNIEFTVKGAEAIQTRGDRDLLFQAISNLVDNAIKYTPEGGFIELELAAGPAGPRFVLSDSGRGIPEADRDRVFERFYRLESHRDSAGNGLGLSLVSAVAKLHETRVLLEDNEPGLRVVWDLPRDRLA